MKSDAVHQVVIVDKSPSMGDSPTQDVAEQARQFLHGIDDSNADVIVLGRNATPFDNRITVVMPSYSLTRAVMMALASVPYGKSGIITLFSDGYAIDDHWEPVMAALQARDVALNWVKTIPVAPRPTIQNMPYAPFFPGQSPEVSINVIARASEAASLTVRLTSEKSGEVLTTQLGNASDNNLYSPVIKLPATDTPFSTWVVELTNSNKQIVDSRSLMLTAQSPIPVLIGTDNDADGEHLQSLLGKAFRVSVAPFPWTDTMDFSRFEAVVLNNASRSALPAPVQRSLVEAINKGTGLLYTGSEQAFSTNGLAGSPLADLLPVTIDNTETKREPGISLAIIIDSSGSMQGQPLALAKQVARLAVRKLKPQDQAGIVEFYGTRQWAVPVQPVQDIESLERAIGKLQAQGSSELFPAIEEAYFGLKNSHNKYRHILLITDAAVEEQNYQKLLQYIASDQINVSTVLVGENASGEEKMANLANWGKGRFYAVNNEFSMVELNFRRTDKIPASAYKEGQFTVRDTTTARPFPALLQGYTAAPLKPTAIAQWTIDNSEDVLLASWQPGAGKVSALMTELFGKGTVSWANNAEYGQKMGDVVASLAALAQKSVLTTTRTSDHIDVHFSTIDSHSPYLQWKRPHENNWQQGSLRLRAPGLYTGKIPLPRDEAAQINVTTSDQDYFSALPSHSDLRPEFQHDAVFTQRLAQVVNGSGGQRLRPESDLKPSASAAKAYPEALALMPFTLALALMLYLSETIYRRWPSRRKTRF
ncbi:VWA domain-containing protein [Alteromonas gilva]|uniref:VWA domain-containing protein n=1 Tax=Alteromonas gilva TaxID=2987522 RepID=A0ABT5KZM3_9ALTE|nr:VWA domain-containing protein [Alteromonas gilva]MDC8830224.1 VWA domain-containing protein [Alteromonas gilva]